MNLKVPLIQAQSWIQKLIDIQSFDKWECDVSFYTRKWRK